MAAPCLLTLMNPFMRPQLIDLNLFFVQWHGIKQSNMIIVRTSDTHSILRRKSNSKKDSLH